MPTQQDYENWVRQSQQAGTPVTPEEWVKHATAVHGSAIITGGGTPSGPSATTGGTINTINGPRTVEQMRSELQAAGYNGPWDDGSVISAYTRTAGGANAGGDSLSRLRQSANDMLNAIAEGNREKFEEAVRQFNEQLAETKRQFDVGQAETKRQFDVGQAEKVRQFDLNLAEDRANRFSETARALLQTAAGLRGPANIPQYLAFTSGGKNLAQRMQTGEPLPAFSAPTGFSRPVTVQDVMRELGLLN